MRPFVLLLALLSAPALADSEPTSRDAWLARVFCDARLAASLPDSEVLAATEYATHVGLACPRRRDEPVPVYLQQQRRLSMPKTGAAAVMRAAEQAKSAQRRVDDCKRALTKAEKARDRADAAYLAMLRASLPGLQESARAGAEVAEQPNA